LQQQTAKNVTQLNVSKLPSGVYMLNIKDGVEVRSMKFVKEYILRGNKTQVPLYCGTFLCE
jgi:hypothetical protein